MATGDAQRRPFFQRKRRYKAERELWIKAGDMASSRRFLELAARDVGLDPRGVEAVLVAVGEAIANALKHGCPCYGGDVHVRVAREDDVAIFEVSDCGTFDNEKALDFRMPELLAEGGRGLPLMSAVMDAVEIDRRPGRTCVRMARRTRTPVQKPGGRATLVGGL